MIDLHRLGEVRHEECRYGTLNPSWLIDGRAIGDPLPSLVPICNLPPPDPAPPWVKRCWAQAVEYRRDCAVCEVFAPVPTTPPQSDSLPDEPQRQWPEML